MQEAFLPEDSHVRMKTTFACASKGTFFQDTLEEVVPLSRQRPVFKTHMKKLNSTSQLAFDGWHRDCV